MPKNMVEPECHKWRHNMAHTSWMLDKQSYTRTRTCPGALSSTHTHTHGQISNTDCFSTVTVFRDRACLMLHVHCLSCLFLKLLKRQREAYRCLSAARFSTSGHKEWVAENGITFLKLPSSNRFLDLHLTTFYVRKKLLSNVRVSIQGCHSPCKVTKHLERTSKQTDCGKVFRM